MAAMAEQEYAQNQMNGRHGQIECTKNRFVLILLKTWDAMLKADHIKIHKFMDLRNIDHIIQEYAIKDNDRMQSQKHTIV